MRGKSLDPTRTIFLVSSKSGTTLETRCHLDFFWNWAGRRAEAFAAIAAQLMAAVTH